MMRKLSNKGQVNSIGPAIIALVIAGVFLILGLVILETMRDTDIIAKVHSATINNETLTTVTATTELLNCGNNPAATCTVSSMINASSNDTSGSGRVVPTTNYSVTGCVVNSTGGAWEGIDWNSTYTCQFADQAFKQGNLTVTGLGTFGDFWEIIVLAIVISVVIGLLLIVFAGRRQR